MKIFWIALFLSSFVFNCIPFKESDLDPSSNLGLLSRLLRLIQLNNLGREAEINVRFRENGVVNDREMFLNVTKINRESNSDAYSLGASLTERSLTDPGLSQVLASQPNFDGNFLIYLNLNQSYRFDVYVEDSEDGFIVIASALLDLNSVDGNLQFKELLTSREGIEMSIVGFREVPLNPNRIYAEDVNFLIQESGNHYFLVRGYSPSNSFFHSSIAQFIYVSRIFIYREASSNWDTVILPNELNSLISLNFSESILAIGNFTTSRAFSRDGRIYFLYRLFDEGTIQFSKTYLVDLSTGTTTSLNSRELLPRFANDLIIDNHLFYPFGDGIIYAERVDYISEPEIRYDSNFLQPGSTNFSIPSGANLLFDLTISSNEILLRNKIFPKNGVLYRGDFELSSNEFFRHVPPGTGNSESGTFSSAGANLTDPEYQLLGNDHVYAITEFSSSDQVFKISHLVSNNPSPPSLETIGNDFVINSAPQISSFETFFSNTKTYYQVRVDAEINPRLISFDHSSQFYQILNYPPVASAEFNPIGFDIVRGEPSMRRYCSASPSKIVCLKPVESRQIDEPVNVGYSSIIPYFTESSNGLDWSQWSPALQ